jgi:cation:H+ antiporter
MNLDISIEYYITAFVISGAIIWKLSNVLSNLVDYIDNVYDLGSAFGGTIMLSVITNLPELAIVIQGTIMGQYALATGNILGGIALQTLLLVLFDFASRKEKAPFSKLTSNLTAIVQGLILCMILGMVIMGTQFRSVFVNYRFTPIEIFIVIAWLLGLLIIKIKQRQEAPIKEYQREYPKTWTKTKALFYLIVLAIGILVLGFVLAESSDHIASHFNVSGVIFGATALALVTSLPEISGGLAFVKNKNYPPVISDIFGGNSFLPLLFLIASILSKHSILPGANHSDIFLTALSMVMTLVFVIGMVIKPKKRYAGLGIDSWTALAIYILGICGLMWV